MRKPFYRKQTKCWYVIDANKAFIRLDPDEEKAFQLWESMRRRSDYKHANASLDAICEAYLADLEHRVSVDRFADQVHLCEAFCLHFGATRKAAEVCGADVLKWVRTARDGTWSLARQRDAGTAIKRALRWAINRGYLPWSDVLELQFTTPRPREATIPYEMHKRLVMACRGQRKSRPFGLVLIALRLSGARPVQLRELTAGHVRSGSWVFADHKTRKRTGRHLIVRLGPCLQTLTRILLAHRQRGPLLLTSLGKPWTKDGIVHRFDRMRVKLKIEGVSAYSYRHSYATDALESGVDVPTVAALLGHTDSSMVSRVYGHLDDRPDHLTRAVETIAKNRQK